jgi:hypothetical protein
MRQLPTEGKRFKHVDATCRQEMINTRENPKIIDICATEGLLEKWRECNITLDMVQKGLEDYLLASTSCRTMSFWKFFHRPRTPQEFSLSSPKSLRL